MVFQDGMETVMGGRQKVQYEERKGVKWVKCGDLKWFGLVTRVMGVKLRGTVSVTWIKLDILKRVRRQGTD